MTAHSVPPPDRIRDPRRLQEIVDLDLFSDEVRALLDETTRRTAARLAIPQCFISLVLDDTQYFASMAGVEADWIKAAHGTPLEWAFCRHVVQDDAPFVVSDATKNERMKNSPLVKEEGVRCYAGFPIRTSKGHTIGSFCVSGDEPRTFTAEELAILSALATDLVRQIELRAGRRR